MSLVFRQNNLTLVHFVFFVQLHIKRRARIHKALSITNDVHIHVSYLLLELCSGRCVLCAALRNAAPHCSFDFNCERC